MLKIIKANVQNNDAKFKIAIPGNTVDIVAEWGVAEGVNLSFEFVELYVQSRSL